MHHIIGFACDHAGFELKETLVAYILNKGIALKDFGSYASSSVDYPDFAHLLGKGLEDKVVTLGIAICGSANGISMALNKHPSVRAAICWNPEIAALARLHNDANVLSLPARFITEQEAFIIVDTFLATNFEGGRHSLRVNKINL